MPMQLRITRDESQPGRVTLMLEGAIVHPWIAEVHRHYLECSAQQTAMVLDLRGVDFIDEQGVTGLRLLIHLGVRLINVQPIIDELLRESRS